MKKIIQIFSFLSLVVVIAAGTAAAQAQNVIKINVPFEFNVGQKAYSAGEYGLKITKNTAGGARITLTDRNGRNLQTVLAAVTGEYRVGESEVLFSNYDNQRFLAKIVTSESGLELSRTKSEKEIAAGLIEPGRKPSISRNIR
jgi:hypothetical protein